MPQTTNTVLVFRSDPSPREDKYHHCWCNISPSIIEWLCRAHTTHPMLRNGFCGVRNYRSHSSWWNIIDRAIMGVHRHGDAIRSWHVSVRVGHCTRLLIRTSRETDDTVMTFWMYRERICVSQRWLSYARIGGNSFLPSQRRTSNFPFCPPVPVRSYSAKTTRCQPHRISIIQPLHQGIIHQLRQRVLLYVWQAATTPEINPATTTYVIVAPPATFEDHLHCYLILPLHVLRNSNRLSSCTHHNCVDSLIVTSQSVMWV